MNSEQQFITQLQSTLKRQGGVSKQTLIVGLPPEPINTPSFDGTIQLPNMVSGQVAQLTALPSSSNGGSGVWLLYGVVQNPSAVNAKMITGLTELTLVTLISVTDVKYIYYNMFPVGSVMPNDYIQYVSGETCRVFQKL